MDDEWWPEDEEDGEPIRPSGSPGPRGPAGTAQTPAAPDYRPLPRRVPDEGEAELAREIARREDGAFEEQIQQIYAPAPVEGQTAVAGVPVALPPRQHAGQFEQVRPGQQVSPEWRHEREAPRDLPQAPESAWAQPPTAPLPVVTPRPAPPDASAPSVVTASRGPVGVPHQVPPAPMPRRAEDAGRTRDERRTEPQAEMGLRGALRKSTFGLISPAPGRREQELNADLEMIERRFGGLRQITVANPAEGAGKTVAVLLLAMTFGQRRGGSVLAWDTGATPGSLGLPAQPDADGIQRLGDFDVLASAESTIDFGMTRDALRSAYTVLVVGTGGDPGTARWRDAIDATDQLVVTIFGRDESAASAARMLDYLEYNGRTRTARQAVTVLCLPQNQRDLDVPGIERHFVARTRCVVRVPFDRAVESRPIGYRQISDATRAAWIRVAATAAEAL